MIKSPFTGPHPIIGTGQSVHTQNTMSVSEQLDGVWAQLDGVSEQLADIIDKMDTLVDHVKILSRFRRFRQAKSRLCESLSNQQSNQ